MGLGFGSLHTCDSSQACGTPLPGDLMTSLEALHVNTVTVYLLFSRFRNFSVLSSTLSSMKGI